MGRRSRGFDPLSLLIEGVIGAIAMVFRMTGAVLSNAAVWLGRTLGWSVRTALPQAAKATEVALVSPVRLACWYYVVRRDGDHYRCQSCGATHKAIRNLTHHGCPAQYQGWIWGHCPVCEVRPRFHHCPNCRIANVNPLTRWPFKSLFE